MLSNEDKKAYLSILARRRKVRQFLAKASTDLSAEMAIADEHRKAADALREEIHDTFKSDLVNLNDYKAQLDLFHDPSNKYDSSLERQAQISKFLKGLNEKLKLIERISDEMKQEIRRHFKGRGKVLPFERQRS